MYLFKIQVNAYKIPQISESLSVCLDLWFVSTKELRLKVVVFFIDP
jgi:hypothetical protein